LASTLHSTVNGLRAPAGLARGITGGSVGIGTTSPVALLQANTASDTNPTGVAVGFSGTHFLVGTAASGLALSKDEASGGGAYITSVSPGVSWDPLGFQAGSYGWYLWGAETPSMVVNGSGDVGIGTTDPCTNSQAASISNCKLSVAGAIQAQEIVVNSGWSDYVFDPDYRLAPLSEVAEYVRENHHLPDIPTSADVEVNGIGVGGMQAKLLAKIEELTLHMIEINRANEDLRRANAELMEANRHSDERISRMESMLEKAVLKGDRK